MLGCNESNIIFQQHLCKLGQLRRSNGRNSQVYTRSSNEEETNWPLQEVFTLQGERHCTTRSCIVDSSTSGESYIKIHGRRRTAHAQFYHVTVRRMTKFFVYYTALPIHLPMNQHTHSHHRESYSRKWYNLKDTGPLRVLGLLLLFMVCGLCFGCVFCCYYLFVLCCFVCCYEDS